MTYDSLNIILSIVLAVTASLDLFKVFSRDLMMLQQNSYRNERYMRWFSNAGESTNPGRIACCIGLLFLLVHHIPFFAGAAVAVIITAWQLIRLCRITYKKPLVWTSRAKRIYGVMLALAAIAAAGFGIAFGMKALCVTLMLLLVISPVALLAANDILRPVEKSINRKYYNEAASILASMPGLKIVGITGSYGKTSTKHYLNRILQEHFSTTMTPGSFNTTMGVIRTVREYLQPYNEVFIVEMGAKQPGDIKEICDLVHPSIGIITAVGEQHLESFKSIENVQRTKFELADALPQDGTILVNNDFEFAANRPVGNTNCMRYAVSHPEGCDFSATDIEYSPTGTKFTVTGKSMANPLELYTKLVGECNVSNLLAAVIVALKLGVPADKIKYAVSQIEQVEHRLNMKRTPGGITIIDDAFNSNPQGSKMALEVLAMMKPGKRIVITPGMIELGELQHKANMEFGHHIARCADVAIIVGQYNRDAILEGISEEGLNPDNVHTTDSFNEAQALLQTIAAPGDTVLYENDLPDTFK
ncbi:MAG: UDP-N-acetylmuramoyl-tripeptide--D-alanyl-D-alanine ligase [Muribaculaceae bacterium]|nr:UDP-N-acetylmuramoyl-tripeptide--D-alanyl-D-alanine ligase [Muribaculaceae bacterium]